MRSPFHPPSTRLDNIPQRSKGHLFITVLAYQLVQVIRRRLRERGEHASWATLRSILAAQQRVTTTFRCADGRTLHVRKATQAEPQQQAIYDALGVAPGSRWHQEAGGRVMVLTSCAEIVVPLADFRSPNSFTHNRIITSLLNLG